MNSKIVILGGGFGGLHAAVKLGRAARKGLLKNFEIVLVDKNDYHTYTPTLYEAATTSKDVADFIDLKSIVTFPIRKIIKGLPIQFIEDEVTQLDLIPREGAVHLKSGYNLHYEYLIVALGSECNDFGIPGIKGFAYEFKTFSDAMRIRDAVWDIMTSKNTDDKEVEVVIGGGGSTGVELAGELRLWLNQLERSHGKKAKVTIIEGGGDILNGFGGEIVSRVRKRLEKLGINIKTEQAIISASKEKRSITLFDRSEVSADVFVWTGGVKPSSVLRTTPFKTARGRIEVSGAMTCLPENPDLSVSGKIFGIGDLACIYDPVTGLPVPMVARAAISEAKVTAINVIRDIHEKKHIEYKPTDYPYVIPVGGKYAVARIGSFVIEGFWGWVLKGLVELNYLMSIMSPIGALWVWLKGLRIFAQNERLG